MCTHLMTKHKRGIQQDETQLIFSILNAFNSATPLPTDIAQGSRLQDVLKNIQGETSRYRGPFAYPEPLQRNATILLDRLAIETGAEESDTAATTSPPEPKPSLSSTRETAKPGWAGGSTTKSTSGSNDLTDAMRNHPIIKHVMRGLMYGREQSRVPKQDPNDTKHKKECYSEGHNGLEMGQWWPYRACALRDGAHGASQGGIAGNGTDGAFSIVVSSESFPSFSSPHLRTFGPLPPTRPFPPPPLLRPPPPSFPLSLHQFQCSRQADHARQTSMTTSTSTKATHSTTPAPTPSTTQIPRTPRSAT